MEHYRKESAAVGADVTDARVATFTLNAPSRALCAVVIDAIDPTLHAFACAPISARQLMQICVYNDETQEVQEFKLVYPTASHIWSLQSSLAHPRSILVTRSRMHSSLKYATVALATITYGPELDEKSKHPNPESINDAIQFPEHPSPFGSATFAGKDSIVTIDSESLRYWKLDRASSSPNLDDAVVFGRTANVLIGAEDPIVADRFVGATASDVFVWDFRQTTSSEGSLKISSAHSAPIKDIDVNPNKPHYIVTASEDASIRFWDLRRPDAPVLMLLGHSHWVWNVEYNHLHDQLLLSSSSDNTVHVWNAQSVSSSPRSVAGIDGPADPTNKIIEIEKHEDSVYRACWSATDAWVYASLSYDGRVIINNIPQVEKYKILL